MDGAKPPCRKRIRRGFDPAAVGDAIGVDAGDHLRFRQPDARVPCWTGADLPFRDHANVRIAAGNILPAGFESGRAIRSEEHTSELQSLTRISYAVFCLNTKTKTIK